MSHPFDFPYQPKGKDYWLLGATEKEVFSLSDNVNTKTPDLMSWLERQYGKEITSRTWLTVSRILKRMY